MRVMRNQKAPRYQGRITSWKDDEGFGFITPNGAGPTEASVVRWAALNRDARFE